MEQHLALRRLVMFMLDENEGEDDEVVVVAEGGIARVLGVEGRVSVVERHSDAIFSTTFPALALALSFYP